ncbi:MAG: thiol:disulfide interchange protein DsbC [Pseudomonadota bacterium]|nr:thiol:disulfide interchange protein DsbC [Pseudomonadota bacterium]
MLKKLLPALVATTLAGAVLADEAAVKKNFETKFGAKAESVTKSGYLGLYEIYADGQILYSDEKGSAFIVGPLIDGKTMKNVTQDRMNKLTAIKWSDLPLDRAVKQVRGDGKRVLASFEDPNCGYCKKLAKEMQKLDNVTIYTFLYPILSQDSVDKSKAIWCSADRAKAWNDWMVEGKAPAGKTDCDTAAVTKNQEYGRKLNINGTPTLFFADGERIPGAVPLPKIEEKLTQTAGK